MSNVEKNASEKAFQENFVKELKKYSWETPESLNGNEKEVTVQDLIGNWREQLNRLNADILEGVPLSDGEFQQVMSKVQQISNSYEAAQILAMENATGKIDGIYRDKHEQVTRHQITLTIFKKAQVGGGDSKYQVAREVVSDRGNRFDIVLLINGLPLINIEQKRSDKTIEEAFLQFQRYYDEGEYSHNFMAFSQMMVITTEIDTRYFATPKTSKDFNESFVFHWSVSKKSQEDNRHLGQHIVTDYREVIQHLLSVPMAHQMVGDYLIIDVDPDTEENRRHMLMRPYQVHALQAIEKAAFGATEDAIAHGGYVWHTTGSGKTITSFKTAQFLSTRSGFDKVVFLLDRKDLDAQTAKAFKAYSVYTPVEVDGTNHTSHLHKQLKSTKHGIVVTTIFKLNSLVKSLVDSQDDTIASKKIAFIIDEAHRSTMGEMMGNITSYFQKNSLFFGFTGTPLFEENKVKGKINQKSELIDTTEKLFGPLLHQYTIDEAIADKNVLGFHVDYVNTGEFRAYDDLREELFAPLKIQNPEKSDRAIQREIAQFSELEVEEKAKQFGLLVYQDETHIPQVVSEILDGWYEQSQGGEFNALLTVAYKERVIAYYREFKKQLAMQNQVNKPKPNIAMTFSFGEDNSQDNPSKEVVAEIFEDYATITGIPFSIDDKKRGYEAYFSDLTERVKRGGSGRNSRNIDIVIVAQQLLTGYDAKRLNTLYVDRDLELQGLIQAYSRTNRIFGPGKEFGTIINFQFPRMTENKVNEALRLYGSGGTSSHVLVDSYDDAVLQLRGAIDRLIDTLPDSSRWVDLQNDEEEREAFKKVYLEAAKQMNRVQQYYEFKWDSDKFGINQKTWLNYIGAYRNLFPSDEGRENFFVRELKGQTKLQSSQVIDAGSLLKLIGQKTNAKDGVVFINDNTLVLIMEKIQELSQLGQDSLSKDLKAFVMEELVEGHLPSDINIDEAFLEWRKSKLLQEISLVADEWGVDAGLLMETYESYDISKSSGVPYFKELITSVNREKATTKANLKPIKFRLTFQQFITQWLQDTKQKYDNY